MGRNYSQTSLSQNILNNQLNNYKSQYKTLLSSRPVTNLIIEDSYSQYPIYNYQPMLYPKYINPLSQSLSLPKIQLGRTINNSNNINNNNCNNNCCNSYNSCNSCNCCRNCFYKIDEVLNYLKSLERRNPKIDNAYYVYPPKIEEKLNPPNIVFPKYEKKEIDYDDKVNYIPPPINLNKAENLKQKIIEKKTTPKPAKKNKKIEKKNWWKLAKDFFYLFTFYSSAIKYSINAKVRERLIEERNENIDKEILILKNWIFSIEKKVFKDFQYFKTIILTYNNLEKHMKKIKSIIKKLMENLFKIKELKDIPKQVQEILYKFIKDKAYFPHSYLTTNQIYRIDFHYYGYLRLVNEKEAGMILAFLLINGILVQQIILNLGKHINEYYELKEIKINGKYIGSIIHNLARESFKNKLKIHHNFLSVLNYFRNYRTTNKDLENSDNILGRDMIYHDKDEFSKYLINFSDISIFWGVNGTFIDSVKKNIYNWSVFIAKLIKEKFSQNNNMKQKRSFSS